LLHDLKNTIVAYSVALSQKPHCRTGALAYKLQASRHRDAALTLITFLGSLWGALARPVATAIDPIRLIRGLVADSMNTLKVGIRIIPPSSLDEEPFTTSADLLRSIVHNLIKNSVEAMPRGGDIRIEVVRHKDVLLIELTDNGPGMSSDAIEKVLIGQPVSSTKKDGNGLGLFTVQEMLKRMAAGSTTAKGLSWTIEIRELAVADNGRMLVLGEEEDGANPLG
jgi:signal transduction histidine kinase